MTLLPPTVPKHSLLSEAHGIVEEKEEEDANYAHNWLYSVVPASIPQEVWDYTSNGQSVSRSEFPLFAFLTGFCRECRKAFSIQIPHRTDGIYFETQMEVPYYGCVKPGTNR